MIFAPAGEIVPAALAGLDRGGRLVLAGIHLTDIPVLRYEDHLFQEREICSVTANTRQDEREFLERASRIPLRVETTPYHLDEAAMALKDLAHDRVTGAAVLRVLGV